MGRQPRGQRATSREEGLEGGKGWAAWCAARKVDEAVDGVIRLPREQPLASVASV